MHDVAIIGAGPIGIELHAALAHAGCDVVHLDAGAIGATIDWWAPQTTFFSSPERIAIAGIPLVTPDQSKATREQYLAYLRGVVMQLGLPVRTFERVHSMTKTERGFTLVTPLEAVQARAVALAIGNMHAERRLGVPGEDLPHVSHYLEDVHRYFGRRVVIVGGKNSAAEAALRLYRLGAEVTVSYRGEAFDSKRVKVWIRPELEWLIRRGSIGWRPKTVPAQIEDAGVTLAGVETGEREFLPCDDVLLLTGYVQDKSLFEQLQIPMTDDDRRAPVVDAETMETPVGDVYCLGTAVGGTQSRAHLFIENAHVHVARITRALTGSDPPFACDDRTRGLAES